jgi:hypothetical protein
MEGPNGKLKMKSLLRIIVLLGCVAPALTAPADGAAVPVQCRSTDRAVTRRVNFARGRTTAVIKDTVKLCTSHEWVLRARGDQTMTVHLATGRKTSFTVQGPSGTIEDADGVKDWSGQLPENGEYVINVGTDATAAYTLEVTIR